MRLHISTSNRITFLTRRLCRSLSLSVEAPHQTCTNAPTDTPTEHSSLALLKKNIKTHEDATKTGLLRARGRAQRRAIKHCFKCTWTHTVSSPGRTIMPTAPLKFVCGPLVLWWVNVFLPTAHSSADFPTMTAHNGVSYAHTHTQKKGGAGLTLRFIFSPNLRRRNSYSHLPVNVSFEDERRRGQRVPLLPRFPPPPLRSLLLNMQIQQRMRLLVGSSQELGQRQRHSVLKARQGFL